MTIWIGLIMALHILVTLLLVLIVLIQGGENVDITAAFGGVSQAAFGPRGTVSTLAKATWVLGGIFIVTSVTLSVWAGKVGSGSVLQHASTSQTAPKSAPAPKPPAPAHK
ncbi:MAG TPA: preprotein translocase subunit SecG [Terriglobia bacterium]|jgi:preprotein translocase subunit SecG|nr:preprotein translocase subunit SecG [Terriglobia bacterium]